jgi:hypothetical protein
MVLRSSLPAFLCPLRCQPGGRPSNGGQNSSHEIERNQNLLPPKKLMRWLLNARFWQFHFCRRWLTMLAAFVTLSCGRGCRLVLFLKRPERTRKSWRALPWGAVLQQLTLLSRALISIRSLPRSLSKIFIGQSKPRAAFLPTRHEPRRHSRSRKRYLMRGTN